MKLEENIVVKKGLFYHFSALFTKIDGKIVGIAGKILLKLGENGQIMNKL